MQSPWHAPLHNLGAHFAGHAAGTTPSGALSFGHEREEVQHAQTAQSTGTVFTPLTDLGLLHIQGDEAQNFLQNLTSNDIKALSPTQAQYSSLNSPKGRILASLLIWRTDTGYRLQCAADLIESIHKKLSLYVLRAKVQISNESAEQLAFGLAGAQVSELLEKLSLHFPAEALSVAQGAHQVIRLDEQRVQIILAKSQTTAFFKQLIAQGAKPVGSNAWQWLDIQAGIPRITALTQDEFVAQMVNFELLGGVNFQKGCYPGQEIVARTQYLGKLKKRMFLAHIPHAQTAPEVGTELFAPDFREQACGKIVNLATSPEGGFDALAVVQISSHEFGEVHLGTPEGELLEFKTLPYAVS